MSIQVVRVPNPAVGVDWSYTIPGQWLAYLLGVSATLTTTAAPTLLADISGNSMDATVVANVSPYTFEVTGPFAGGADNLGILSDGSGVAQSQYVARSPSNALFNAAVWTIEGWVFVSDPVDTNDGGMWSLNTGAGTATPWGWWKRHGGGDPYDLTEGTNGGTAFTLTNQAGQTAWHHLAISWDGAQWDTYVDGAHKSTHVGNPPGGGVGRITLLGNASITFPLDGTMSHVAYYPTNLSLAQVAAHAAASGSAAAYQAAVLADAPNGFWPMTERYDKSSRHATLNVTDGTNTVMNVPAGFTQTNNGVFLWSWQVLGSGVVQSVDGAVASVSIPEMLLPAGYIVSARTLDLASTDQWSDVTLWFDDNGGGTGAGLSPLEYLNVHLVAGEPRR